MEVFTFLGLSIVSFIEWAIVLIFAWPLTTFLIFLVVYALRRTSSRAKTIVVQKMSSSQLEPIMESAGATLSPTPQQGVGHRRNRSLGYTQPAAPMTSPTNHLSRCESVSKMA
eukprot:m.242182 g.242182  ORF g.242182 m.242182 type:complete len:113 (-) comp13979_c0_seq1:585-923(-)